MKEFVEKLTERLEEEAVEVFRAPTVNDEPCTGLIPTGDKDIYLSKVIEIVNQLAEEYINTSTDISTEQLEERKTITAEEVIDKLYYGLQNIFVTLDTAKSQLSDVYEGCSSDIDLLDCSKDLTKNNNGWISCSERLPENYETVNITWVNKKPESYYEHIKDKPFMGTAIFHYGKWYWYSCVCEDYLRECGDSMCDRMDKDIEVIAWQPLPAPYKPEEKPKFSNEELDRIMDKILDNQDLDKVKQEPKTRIEYIRSMSVEELADAILERSEISTAIDFCQKFEECWEGVLEDECRKCLIKWLNSLVEQKKTIPTDHFKERFNRVV